MGKKQCGRRKRLYLFFAVIIIMPFLAGGCTHWFEKMDANTDFDTAGELAQKGNFKAALDIYEQIVIRYPQAGDRALFEIGIIHAAPENQEKDYQKSLESFQQLVQKYPKSTYGQNSNLMISLLNEITSRNKKMVTQRKQIESLEQQIEQLKEIDLNMTKKKKSFQKRQ